MLLRRVIEHVKAQNWTAVGIDFAIVVIGVFIGIQVANWNDDRREEATRQQVHQRLLQDFALIEARSDNAVDYVEQLMTSLVVLQQAIERGNAETAEHEQIKFALERGYSYPTISQRSGTYIELLSSGRLDLIANDEIRAALSEYDRQVQQSRFNESQINEFMSDNVSLVLFGQYRTFAPPARNADGELARGEITRFDIEGMAADTDFRAQLDRLIENRTWLIANIYHQREAIEDVMATFQDNQ